VARYLICFAYFVQQALVGEGSGEEELFSSKSSRDGIGNDINVYHKKIKVFYLFNSNC